MPRSGKISHAAEQLGPWAMASEPERPEPVLRNGRGHNSERTAYRKKKKENYTHIADEKAEPQRGEVTYLNPQS